MKYIFIIGLVLVLLNSVSAEILTDSSIDKCSCDNLIDTYKIINEADIPRAYSINLEGNGVPLTKLKVNRVIIPAKQSFDLEISYPSACTVFGSYDVKTIIRDNLGYRYSIVKRVNITQCNSLTADVTYEPACKGNKNTVDLKLENAGMFTDIGRVDVIGYDSYTISQSNFSMDEGDEKSIEIVFNSKNSGMFYPYVQIRSFKSGQLINIPLEIEFDNCYDIVYEIGDYVKTVCGKEFQFDMDVQNKGSEKQIINISYDSNLNIELTQKDLSLNPGRSRNIGIYANSEGPGEYYIDIEGHKIQFEAISDFDCNKIELIKKYFIINNESQNLNIVITNNGIEGDDYKVYDYENIYYDMHLEPGEKHDISLDINNHNPGEYYHGIWVESSKREIYKLDVNYRIEPKKDENKIILIAIALILVFTPV